MDYNKLLHRLAELDQPTNEACGEMAPMSPSAPPSTPPSMSVNLNAQGMENIEQLMKLMTKVNPDMINPSAQPAPTAAPMLKLPIDRDGVDDGPLDGDKSEVAPIIGAVGAGLGRAALSGAGALGRAALSGAGAMARGAGMSLAKTAAAGAGPAVAAAAPSDSSDDGDVSAGSEFSHEEYANQPDEEYKDIDYITNKLAGGLNKPKGTYPKVATGDNPMQKINQMEGDELRAAIRSELQQRLAEAKGAK